MTPLSQAAQAGELARVKQLLQEGTPADHGQPTPLWLVCGSDAPLADQLRIAEALLEAGANPRALCGPVFTTPLHQAVERGSLPLVELLIRHGAKEWQGDHKGVTPLEYARKSTTVDRDKIIHLLDRPVIDDPHFKSAVRAIHAGDLAAMAALLAAHPTLTRQRAIEPACYGQDYFRDPKLLWFIANNPNLTPHMPPNIVAMGELIIQAGVDQEDLDYTLGLVTTSSPARQDKLQLPLMKLLIDHGAKANAQDVDGTLGHGEVDAVRALLDWGMTLTLPVAAALGMLSEVESLLPAADASELQRAFGLAVINRQVAAAKRCLDAGADIDAPMIVHAHSWAIHQAAVNDDVPMLELLVARGSRLDRRDTLWGGTPRGWAFHTHKPQALAYLQSINAL